MNEDLALELVQELRDEYENSAVIGEEIRGNVVENRHQDSFEVLGNWIPISSTWVTGDTLPEISRLNLPSVVSGFHQAERWFLLEHLDQANNVPEVSIPEVTHNNLIDPLTEVYNPTHLYVPRSEPFLEIQSQKAINSITDAFDDLAEVGLNTDEQRNSEACYAIRGDYIQMDQCTRLPLDQSEWLPDRAVSTMNEKVSEHSLYCSYGVTDKRDSDYELAVASILSDNPTIQDNAAVKITVEDDD